MQKGIQTGVAAFAIAMTVLMGGCKAQGQQSNVPDEVLKQAYFNSMTCQGAEARHQFDEAERYCKLGLSELEGYTHPLQEALYSALIDIYLYKDRYDEAEQLQKKMIDLTARLHGKQSVNYAIAIAAYGSSMVRDGKFSDAIPYINEVLPVLKAKAQEAKTLSWSYDWYNAALNRLMVIQVSQHNDAAALKTIQEWANYRGRGSLNQSELQTSLANIYAEVGEVYYHLPNLAKARPFYERALALNKQTASQLPRVQENAKRYIKTTVIPRPEIVMAGQHLVDIYRKSGQIKEATALACQVNGWTQYYKAYPPA